MSEMVSYQQLAAEAGCSVRAIYNRVLKAGVPHVGGRGQICYLTAADAAALREHYPIPPAGWPTTACVARRIGVDRRTVQKWIRAGLLPSVRHGRGRRWRVDREAVNRLVRWMRDSGATRIPYGALKSGRLP